ncbi:MAG: YcxB family protein [Sporolactobacillus sp.]
MEDRLITFAGTLTYQEYKTFCYAHARKAALSGILIVWFAGFLINLTLLPWQYALLLAFLIALAANQFMRILAAFRYRQEFNSDRLSRENESRYLARENGLLIRIEGRLRTFYRWDDFIRVIERPELIVLYVSKNKVIIIPKRYFKSNDDLAAFRRLLSVRLPVKKRPEQ